mmetsp:Transcript_4826/g.9689  ORF Transcript_4826/g.9689 Transcript_4826/m.9689 type:complete len:431 (-) Transcript_4826:28-1320(-)
MSSFRKKTKSKSKSSSSTSSNPISLHGTKPWINSTTLISTGHRDLDAILGGGQVLGTSALVLVDRWSDFGSTLGRYWAAEGLANGQQVVVVDFDELFDDQDRQNRVDGFLASLPLDMNLAKKEKMGQRGAGPTHDKSPSLAEMSLAEGNEDEDEDDDDENFEEERVGVGDDHLKVAWQYKSSVQRKNNGSSTSAATPVDPYYCHSFDLSETIQQVHLDAVPLMYKNLSSSSHVFKDLVATIEKATKSSSEAGTNRVVRLVLRQPPFRSTSAALTLLRSYVMSKKLPVAIFILAKPWEATRWEGDGDEEGDWSNSSLVDLTRSVDVAFRVDGFGGLVTKPPGEFKDFAAIFTVLKIGTKTGVSTRRPAAMRWGIKRDRRKLHIKMLHLPPEDYSDRGSAGGGARSGGGGKESTKSDSKGKGKMACSSGLDF